MKKLLLPVMIIVLVVMFAGILAAGENQGERNGPAFRGDFDFMPDRDDPRLEELRKLREEFKETIKNSPVDKAKLRSLYGSMKVLRQKMADDAFEKFLQRIDVIEDRKERREERKEGRENRPKK